MVSQRSIKHPAEKFMKFHQIAVINKINLTDEGRVKLREFSEEQIVFPETEPKDEEEILRRIGGADAVLGSFRSQISKNIFEKCTNLKYVGICGTNLTLVDLEEAKKRGVIVTNVADYGDEATAEWVFLQLLMFVRRVGDYSKIKFPPTDLKEKTIGIIGMGAIGKQVAKRALAFDMHVLYFSKEREKDWEKKGVQFMPVDELLKKSDIVSLHVPMNTVVLGKKEFAQIKPGAVLVDPCLGTVFDTEAFVEWIKKGQNFAILNLKEHLSARLSDLSNVFSYLEPGAMTPKSREALGEKFLENIIKYLN